MTVKIGIIGGSGLDNPDLFKNLQDLAVNTPWGKPSADLKIGKIEGVDVVLIGRHGREHTIPPTQVNYRANIKALKDVGCTHILATTAVGSLREEIGRGHLVIPDQFIDFTKQRKMTFHESFKPHEPIHTPMAEPFNSQLRNILIEACSSHKISFHKTGTVVTIEGPRFSTRAESKMFRLMGADIINMSVATEVSLANEIGIPYAAIAMSTDYDCWKEDEEPVSWDTILEVFKDNADKVTRLLLSAIPIITNT
jgi:5'-methylthioadenosine phosphorylase